VARRSAGAAHVRDYFGILRDYSVEEWMNDIVPQGAVKSVHVPRCGARARLDETRWLASVADKQGFPAWPRRNAIWPIRNRAALKAQKQFRICAACGKCCLGCRSGAPGPAKRADFCKRSDFRRALRCWKSMICISELQSMPQAKHAVELIKAFPNVRMILCMPAC